jgi:D-alanyl-D-alanine carboxypeptidase
MTASRRSLFAAVALALTAATPLAAAGRSRKAPGCRAREAYLGEPLHFQLPDEIFSAASAAAKPRLHQAILDRIDDAFDRLAPHGRPGIIAGAAATADGALWNQVRGAPRGAEPTRFFWPGLREMCLATAVIQAAEEGRLSLEDRMTRWSPQTPGAAAIKVEDLIVHTSGLTGAAPAFCPGAGWAQSDADAALLTTILQTVDGKPLHESLASRIGARLMLEETTFLAPGQDLPGLSRPPGFTPQSGEPAASAPDVVRIWRALMGARLHAEAATRARFYRLYPVTGRPGAFFGQAVMAFDRPRDLWLGLTGEAAGGARSLVAYSTRKQVFAAFTTVGGGELEPLAEAIFAALLAPGEVDPALKKPIYTPPPRRRRKRR